MASFYWRAPFGGNWSTLANWRTTATGTIAPTAVPTTNDIIYFDDESFYDTDDKGLFTTITLTANSNCNRIINTTTKPFRLQGDIVTKPHQGRTLYCQTTLPDYVQSTLNSLFGSNGYYDGNNIMFQISYNYGGTAVKDLIWPRGITEEEYLERYISLSQLSFGQTTSVNNTTQKIIFNEDVFLASSRLYFSVSNTTGKLNLFSSNNSKLTFGGLGYTQGSFIDVNNTLIFNGTDKYGIQYTASGGVFQFPVNMDNMVNKIIIDNYGKVEMRFLSGTRNGNYKYSDIEINFHTSNPSLISLGGSVGTTSFYELITDKLVVNGMGPNNIVKVGDNTSYPNDWLINNELVVNNVSLFSSYTSPTGGSNVNVSANTIVDLKKIEFQRIRFSILVDAINSKDVPQTGQSASQNINFITGGGEKETVEVTALFNEIITSVNKLSAVGARATFGPINVNINTIRESILAVEAEFGEVVVEVSALGQTGEVVEEREVTAIFGEILTSATQRSATITSRTVTATVGEITTSVNYAVIVPANVEFGEINTSVETKTKAIREYEVTSTFGEVNTFARIFILYKLPSQIILEIKEPIGTLTFDATHLHFNEEEGRNHLWPTAQTV